MKWASKFKKKKKRRRRRGEKRKAINWLTCVHVTNTRRAPSRTTSTTLKSHYLFERPPKPTLIYFVTTVFVYMQHPYMYININRLFFSKKKEMGKNLRHLLFARSLVK